MDRPRKLLHTLVILQIGHILVTDIRLDPSSRCQDVRHTVPFLNKALCKARPYFVLPNAAFVCL